MSKRLYYVYDDITHLEKISEFLKTLGVGHHRYHVVSNDDAGLAVHHLHIANPLQTKEFIRFGERGALIGLIIGAIAAGVILEFQRFYFFSPLVAFLVITGVITFHGAWTGGMAGLSTSSPMLRKFHTDLEAGRHVLMIDVKRGEKLRIENALKEKFGLLPRDENSTLILPFS